MDFKCPKCQSLIYSRKHKTCSQCGEVLPPELLLTDEQIRTIAEQRKREHQRAKGFDLGDDSGNSYV